MFFPNYVIITLVFMKAFVHNKEYMRRINDAATDGSANLTTIFSGGLDGLSRLSFEGRGRFF